MPAGLEPHDQDERAQAESLARVQAGGIPVGAERRLASIRDAGESFTSDLSTADFALCHQLGLRPLAQVMGSSIYQVGYEQGWPGESLAGGGLLFGGGEGYVAEMETLSRAWNEARERSLARLAREAALVGADVVVGVELRTDVSTFGDSVSTPVIDYAAIGTAVRAPEGGAGRRARDGAPVLTELGVADYVKLVSAGLEPAGIAGWSAVFISTYGYNTAQRIRPAGGLLAGQECFELREFTAALYAARERVMAGVAEQARAAGAAGIVGVRVSHHIAPRALGSGNQSALMVTFHAIGTAIRDGGKARFTAPKTIVDLTT